MTPKASVGNQTENSKGLSIVNTYQAVVAAAQVIPVRLPILVSNSPVFDIQCLILHNKDIVY